MVTEKPEDLVLPARVLCSVGFVPEELAPMVSLDAENGVIIDWRRDSALLQHVSFQDVVLGESPRRAPDVTETAFRDLGYDVLADGAHGPAIVEKRSEDTVRVAFLFQPERSTLPYRVGFPVLLSNLAQLALRQANLSEVAAAETGVLPALNLAAGGVYHIEGPGGFRAERTADPQGKLRGAPAPFAGQYSLSGPGAPVKVGVSLLSPAETSLAPIEQIEFNEKLKVTAASSSPRTDRSLWWGLACAALAVLILEWWWFHRRPLLARSP